MHVTGSAEIQARPDPEWPSAVDVTFGLTLSALSVTAGVSRRVAHLARPVVGPLAGLVLRPPLLAERHHPATWLASAARHGHSSREVLYRDLAVLIDELVPAIASAVIARMGLTELVDRYVDLDALVATVDLDAIVATVDIDAIARRLDLDAVIERLDLNSIVLDRVDLDRIVGTVDLDVVAARIDIEAVIDRIDLVGLVEEVIAEVDLPEIIRESTGSMASETVRGVRMQGVSADQAIGRTVDRFRLRRSRRSTPGTVVVEVIDGVGDIADDPVVQR